MKLWLSKNSEVPMREQLITQITLGVASGDLQTGEKLPSRGEIARRFDIHANTVSSAYRELSEIGLIEYRQGSGFYVCRVDPGQNDQGSRLDRLTAEYLRKAQGAGYNLADIQKNLQKYLSPVRRPISFLLIESDARLREILICEIVRATGTETIGISFEDYRAGPEQARGQPVALNDEKEKLQPVLPSGKTCLYLRSNSVAEAMRGETRPAADSLIAVVSGWEPFLSMAKTMLIAARIEGDSIITRDTSDKNWQRGLGSAAMIICDSLTAGRFPADHRVRPFQLLSDESIGELAGLIENQA